MALSSTIFKAQLDLSDLNRNHYESYKLTLARHPSENDQRMMLRLLAFALFADEHLSFTKGISTAEEPDLWIKNYSGEIELWIDLGTPDESRIRKASGRAHRVVLYVYGDRSVPVWWSKQADVLRRFEHLRVIQISDNSLTELVAMAGSSMSLQAMIEDGYLTVSSEEHSGLTQVELTVLKP